MAQEALGITDLVTEGDGIVHSIAMELLAHNSRTLWPFWTLTKQVLGSQAGSVSSQAESKAHNQFQIMCFFPPKNLYLLKFLALQCVGEETQIGQNLRRNKHDGVRLGAGASRGIFFIYLKSLVQK